MLIENKKTWILGPCSIENEQIFMITLDKIVKIFGGNDNLLNVNLFIKSSFDKANRSSLYGNRGVSINQAIEIWTNAKEKYPNVKLTTDVHDAGTVHWLAKETKHGKIIDCIQVPAFLSMQTDLVVECARYFDIVNLKKMQGLGPERYVVSIDKIKDTNPNCQAWITDRGTNFGYHDLFLNPYIVDELKTLYDKVILDVTHGVQRSRKIYGTQADYKMAKRWFLTSDIFKYDGIFAEVHPNPKEAISDKDSQIYLKDLENLIDKSNKIERIINEK